MGESAAYPLGGTDTEKWRLLTQAKMYEASGRMLLDAIGIQQGWRAVDIGCGPIGILDLLSERVGSQGSVVGLEREPRFVAMAREEVSRRGLGNVHIVEADALHTGLDRGAFDVVHERLVLINVSDREAFLTEMLSLLRPGGTIVLEDVDNVSWLCYPSHPSWDALFGAFHAVFHARGGDGFIGRRLPALLNGAGVEEIHTKVHGMVAEIGDYRRTHLVSLIDSIRDNVIALGVLSEQELRDHRESLVRHLAEPTTIVLDKLLVQCWGHTRQ